MASLFQACISDLADSVEVLSDPSGGTFAFSSLCTRELSRVPSGCLDALDSCLDILAQNAIECRTSGLKIFFQTSSGFLLPTKLASTTNQDAQEELRRHWVAFGRVLLLSFVTKRSVPCCLLHYFMRNHLLSNINLTDTDYPMKHIKAHHRALSLRVGDGDGVRMKEEGLRKRRETSYRLELRMRYVDDNRDFLDCVREGLNWIGTHWNSLSIVSHPCF